MQAERKWVTINEAAGYIGMSVAFVRKGVRNKTIPHSRVGGKSLRFDLAALDAYMAANAGCGVLAPQNC